MILFEAEGRLANVRSEYRLIIMIVDDDIVTILYSESVFGQLSIVIVFVIWIVDDYAIKAI